MPNFTTLIWEGENLLAIVLDLLEQVIFSFSLERVCLNSFRSLGPRIWRLVPDELKAIKSLNVFKEKIKSFEFKDCPCNLCKDYIQGVGYLD